MIFNILAVGLMGTAMALSPMQPRYVVDNQNETLTFSAEELNNNKYQYLAEKINTLDDDSDISNTTLTYNGTTFTYLEWTSYDSVYYKAPNNDRIYIYTGNGEEYGKWFYLDIALNDTKPFTTSMTINDASWFIANIEEPPSLTLSKYDLNNKKYTYLAEQLNNASSLDLSNTSITYNNLTYDFSDYLVDEVLIYAHQDNEIFLTLEEINNAYAKWQYFDNTLEENTPFTASITINNAEWFIQNINAPLDSGDMMTAITSGLPLMANLAQAFLNGFTSIFWNSTTNTLTTFSNFALIMLSVAIVFACIKLVLNLVRSNTGV